MSRPTASGPKAEVEYTNQSCLLLHKPSLARASFQSRGGGAVTEEVLCVGASNKPHFNLFSSDVNRHAKLTHLGGL
ncbi:hypothetical protein PhaeoP59_02620 [Phaeobacter inhibens]|nr:hypothetical protein PhaeoP59_02620 [Phaeobacter inhibens]